ncbi:MAG: hypothetical protein K2O81_01890, partial [Clostridia bacterium]|nr:hypothetical protein [Clostridia bacterium]
LMLVIPDGMDEFTLYKMSGDRLTEVSVDEYVTDGRTVTIRTTIPAEFVFNTAATVETAKSGIPWWVWLLVGLGGATLITVIIVAVVLSKRKRDEKTVTVQGGTQYDDAELKAKLTEQDRKLDEIKEIVDGGFNDFVDGE